MMCGQEGSTMTTRKRHTPEQVVRKLATADRMLGEVTNVQRGVDKKDQRMISYLVHRLG
jgi:hypothetical protein